MLKSADPLLTPSPNAAIATKRLNQAEHPEIIQGVSLIQDCHQLWTKHRWNILIQDPNPPTLIAFNTYLTHFLWKKLRSCVHNCEKHKKVHTFNIGKIATSSSCSTMFNCFYRIQLNLSNGDASNGRSPCHRWWQVYLLLLLSFRKWAQNNIKCSSKVRNVAVQKTLEFQSQPITVVLWAAFLT
jgi:hypothetical protein